MGEGEVQHSAERHREAAMDADEARVEELARYHAMTQVQLEEAVSAQMVYLDVYVLPALEEAEQTVRDMEDLFAEAMAITPDMEDELTEARLRWAAAQTHSQVSQDVLDDMMQVQFICEQAWALTPP